MECKGSQNSGERESLAELPFLFQYISSKAVAGFDNVEDNGDRVYQFQTTSSSDPPLAKGTEAASFESQPSLLPSLMPTSTVPAIDLHPFHSISISMPTSPSRFCLQQAERVILADNTVENVNNYGVANSPAKSAIANTELPKQAKFYSQPIPSGITHAEAVTVQRNLRSEGFKDKPYNSFKTWSGKLERQISNLRGHQQEEHPEINDTPNVEIEILPVGRFFDALEGPELDTLKASEELVLPEHKQWPFLLRYPLSSFGICLGVSSQAILWKALATSPSMRFLHAVRINFFRGFRFSWAWWAYTFPMTGASIATVRYSNKVSNPLTQSLSVVLSAVSTLMVTALFISTVFHAIVLRDLFPNDIAIAIAKGRPNMSKKRLNLISASSDTQVNKAASLTRSVDV